MSCASRHIVLLGSTGLLSRAIQKQFHTRSGSDAGLTVADSRRIFHEVMHSDSRTIVRLLREKSDQAQDWICASGIVDPRVDRGLLLQVNAEFPARLFQTLCQHSKDDEGFFQILRFITIGSVLENREDIGHINPYIHSKAQLLRSWQRLSSKAPFAWLHVQLHTLYGGGEPHPFMFLGQMLAALKKRQPFPMSEGIQLREYHHVEDISESLLAVQRGSGDQSELLELIPTCIDQNP